MKTLKNYFVIVAFLIAGFLLMGILELFALPEWLNGSFVLLFLFVVVNLITVNIFQLKKDLQMFWSIRKMYLLPIGVVVGGLIAVIPVLAGILSGKTTIDNIELNTTFSGVSIAVTLAIVAWEELWFRGIFVNYCNKQLSSVHISLTIGLLFMLVHLLNPEINLLKTGPTLFFAGAFLTIVYFYFKSIWLPIGLHFGNNYFSLKSSVEHHWFLGNEGYLGAIVLAGLFFVFVKLTVNKK